MGLDSVCDLGLWRWGRLHSRKNADVGSIWIAELRISEATARKLQAVHDLDPDDVRRAVQCVDGLRFTWDDDPDRGVRAIVETRVGSSRVLVVVYPVADHPMGDVWNLGSAYRVGQP